jgi:hypothetical protein
MKNHSNTKPNLTADTPLNGKSGMATAVKIAARILCGWGASYDQATNILRISRSVYANALNGSLQEVKLDKDQLSRAAMVASIHGSIRTIFSNPENVTGFMRMSNNNDFFDGRSPMDVISDGNFISLYETFRRIDGLRGAAW